ncbi:hypothetical protein [uncultured Winogradskyella sp.]|uniref:hypothetical protein n=1 Tax=uncultured Winogradskyella sp. TaxID=395353 RepID=UPI002628BA81|nr:hypothetical protein [uncultured Winogradskyella sp.]
MKLPIFAFIFLFASYSIIAQEKDSVELKHKTLFKKITSHGGTWVGENPKYDASKPDDFKVFVLKIKLSDPLKIEADILGVNTKNDTIPFWQFSEFYAPDKKKNIFYQRSMDGLYYAYGEPTMTETERYCEMAFYYSGGEYLKHKDTHILLDENTMKSISYDYDPKSQTWINESILIWKLKK